ncbi:MAG: 16S rRNA (cytosine(1402)-N(4))-methyltransferase RsmH [Candidatus Promineofilum sp.]|nr:16S rRNA (cytosine(1402)-N(4))-methyltransferase RsmH [Promineifilum sp.]MBP9656895.1 16S rRNA (cytosine(1402)-N(4))-methyltransferase RsmH [Promineifilum sp.]
MEIDEQPVDYGHTPVLLREAMALLDPRPGGLFIDGTLGAGGHAQAILDAIAPDGRLLGFDRDPEALAFAGRRLTSFGGRFKPVVGSYGDMATVAPALGFHEVDGVLLDLGLSSRQLENAERGFSFIKEAPLDMRFDPRRGESAADLINNLSAEELADIFWRYGEETQSRHFARLIVANRPIGTTTELAGLIAGGTGRHGRPGRHPATKVFQALRIAVNDELGEVERGLHGAIELLRPGGRLAVISFHSLEDRLVKQFFRNLARDCICPPEQPVCTCGARAAVRLVTRKAVKATAEEIAANPRSRSARLRVVSKVDS